MDYTDITYEIERIQSSIRYLQNLIKRSYDGQFTDGKRIIYEASIGDADNAYESLEQVKALCDVLSDAFDDMISTST